MSAAVRLLRSRSSTYARQFRYLSGGLSSCLSRDILLHRTSAGRSRVFSGLADGPVERPPPKRNGWKYAAAGAAVIILSSAAWYNTRELPAQHVELRLPEIIRNHQPLGEEASTANEEKVSTLSPETNEVEDDEHKVAEGMSVEPQLPEVVQFRQEIIEQGDQVTEKDGAADEVQHVYETVEVQHTPDNTTLLLIEQNQVSTPTEEDVNAGQTGLVVIETHEDDRTGVSDTETILLVEDNGIEGGAEEGGDSRHANVGLEVNEDVKAAIRSKLEEDNPDMFFSDERSVNTEGSEVEETKGKFEVPILEEKGKSIEAEAEAEPKVAEVVGVDVLLGAIRTAEQLQAERDRLYFQNQIKALQDVHEAEVKDFQAKIFAYAHEADRLEKELREEKEHAEAELKSQTDSAEERLQSQLKRKDDEAALERDKLETLAKANTAAAVTREKAEHLENIHDMQLRVNALRTAFFAHSEEARISHTAHKLAMGAFALEDAIGKGKPVKKEAELLVASAGGHGGDELIDAVLSSIPDEALKTGSWTPSQLHDKLTRLKGPMRELVLIPAGGGGVLAHLLAKVTASLKIAEQGSQSVGVEGFEAVIGRVERYLAEGKLPEAATVLENGAIGTAAEELAAGWAKQARDRAVIDQAIRVLQAHVVTIASGLA